jgi:hypothetical protein
MNAYILDWTMDDYPLLKQELADARFEFVRDGDTDHIRVNVPYVRLEQFAAITRPYFNAPFNYIDLQFPAEKKTVIIFQERIYLIEDDEQNEQAKMWAIAQGLPPEQADWPTSY